MATKEQIIQAFSEKKLSMSELAQKLFVSENQLKTLLESWGVEIRKKRQHLERPSRQELLELYNSSGNTIELAKHYGTGVNTVNRWLKAENIPTKKLNNMNKEEKIKYLEEHLSRLDNVSL